MTLCMTFREGVALVAHKVAFGSAAPGSVLCGVADNPDLGRDRVPVPASAAGQFGSIDPEGRAGFGDGQAESRQTEGAAPPATMPELESSRVPSGMTQNPAVTPAETPSRTEIAAVESQTGEDEAERPKGDLRFSGGFSSFEGLNAKASMTVKGVGDGQQEISARAQYSRLQALGEIGLNDTRFLGGNTLFSVRLFYNRLDAVGFSRNRRNSPFAQESYGLSLYAGRTVAEKLSLSAQYRLSRDDVSLDVRNAGAGCDPTLFGSATCASLGERTSSIASFSLSFDRRDNSLFPSRGVRMRLVQDLAGLGGQARFSRTRLAADGHVRLGGGFTLSLGAEAGVIAGGKDRRVPVFERFYLGGTSLRGFDLRGVGPRLRPAGPGAIAGADIAIGGRSYYAGRVELSLKPSGSLGRTSLKPVVFADFGSAFNGSKRGLLPGETVTGNSARPRIALGAGLGWETPLGTLRFDAARPVKRQTGDRAQTLSISLGSTF